MSAAADRPRAPLLERADELEQVAGLLRAAGAGESRLVVVEGPAGIGKSRLIAELRARAQAEGVQVLTAHGSDLERDFPFGVVRQLFDRLLADPAVAAELLEGSAASARAVFETVGAGADGVEDVSFAALHGLYWLTVNAAGDEPVMLVVDDVHWCDRSSLRMLAYLARRLEGLGGVLVLGLRTAEPGTDPLLLGELVAHPDALHLTLGPLTGDGTAALVADRLGAEPEEAFTTACLRATGGNPLLLRQLLSSLEADGVRPRAAETDAVRRVGPRAVARTVLLRLARLSPAASAVARAVAVLGGDPGLPLVGALSGLDESDVVRASGELARAEILRPELPLEFVHPLVRDAVYHELASAEREQWHARAARLLADAGRPAEAVATQLLAAPRRGDAWVVERLLEAAGAARRQGAVDAATAFLERALAEPPEPEQATRVVLELGVTETLTSGPDAAKHLREAWQRLTDPRERADVAALLARTLLFTSPPRNALAVVDHAIAETPTELVDELQALQALRLMAVFFGADDTGAADGLRDVEIVGDGPGAKMLLAITAFMRALTGSSAQECVPMALEALADGTLIAVDPGLFPVAAITVLVMADRDEALQAWDALRELAHRGGSMLGILTVGLWRGRTLLWRGDLVEAEESLRNVTDDFLAWGLVSSTETYVPAFLGATLVARGDLRAAREVLDASSVSGDRTDGDRHLLRARALLLLAEGRYAEALDVAEELEGMMTFIGLPAWAGWIDTKARALHGLGRTDEASALAEEGLAASRRFGSPGLVGRSLTLVGELRREEGIEALQEAVTLLETASTRLDLAEALVALGGALRRARRPTEARAPLLRALELAGRCGADGLAEEARSELRAAGVRPRTTVLQGAGALTASERRVADLAAAGASNKAIAQTLFVTPKTVEVHLSSAYRKLAIRSRQELSGALAG